MSNYYTNIQTIGDNILFRGIVNGRRKRGRVKFSPQLFTPTTKTTDYTSLDGGYLAPLDFDTMGEAREFVKKYKDVDNFKIYGMQSYEYVYIAQNFPGHIDWSLDQILIANIDLEWGSANGFAQPETALEPITAITIKLNNKIYAFGCGAFAIPEHLSNVKYIKCFDEIDLINRFIDLWTSDYPDVVTGWNIGFADIPYLINRIKRVLGEDVANKLSPWGQIRTRLVTMMGRDHNCYDIVGIGSLDYMELYRKFAKEGTSRESYKLDYICYVELGEKKLLYEEYETLHRLYIENFQLFMEYNIRDVLLVDKLEVKLKLLELAFTLAYDSKSNYNDVFRQTRMWDSIIYNWLWERKIIIPPKSHMSKDTQFIGAAVKSPQLGRHKWVVSFDLTSLYPHLQMQYNLSPETLLEPHEYPFEIREMLKQNITLDTLLNKEVNLSVLKKHNLTITPNRQIFRTDFQGFIPQIIEQMFNDRKAYKKEMLDAERELEEIERELRKRGEKFD